MDEMSLAWDIKNVQNFSQKTWRENIIWET
jgi:hypothetical protein